MPKARPSRPKKRTFQVAFFGPAGAGRTTTLRALHSLLPKDRLGDLCEVPQELPVRDGQGSLATTNATLIYFDYLFPQMSGISATVRFRTIGQSPPSAFLSLIGADAMVFVFDSRPGSLARNEAALQMAKGHCRTYQQDWTSFPLSMQLTHLDHDAAEASGNPLAQVGEHERHRVPTNPRTGQGLLELAEVIGRALVTAHNEGLVKGRTTRALSKAYLQRARALAAAADIAVSVRPGEPWALELATGPAAVFPELGFGTLRSLAYQENAFFTYWNEASGAHVDTFWATVAERGLPFLQRDPAREILDRNLIKTELDCEVVADVLANVDDDRFTDTERQRLEALLVAYEAKA